jgi:hypothetical protein
MVVFFGGDHVDGFEVNLILFGLGLTDGNKRAHKYKQLKREGTCGFHGGAERGKNIFGERF